MLLFSSHVRLTMYTKDKRSGTLPLLTKSRKTVYELQRDFLSDAQKSFNACAFLFQPIIQCHCPPLSTASRAKMLFYSFFYSGTLYKGS